MSRPKTALPKPTTDAGRRILEALEAGAGTTDPIRVREFAGDLAEDMGLSRSIPREWMKSKGGRFREPGAEEVFERQTGYRAEYVYTGDEPKMVRQSGDERRKGPTDKALRMADMIAQLSSEAQAQLEPFIKMLVLSERAHYDVIMRRGESIEQYLQRLTHYFGDEPPDRRGGH